MEGAPLRPVPTRPAAPVDADAARRHVSTRLPSLDGDAVTAVALVELGGRTRDEAAAQAGLSADQLGAALARGRKALRRSLYPLPGSGWCERAERMLSDRLDGELRPPGPARLDAHMANCPRCVEHERRLAHAIDALARAFMEARPPEDVRVRPAVRIETAPPPAAPVRRRRRAASLPTYPGPRAAPAGRVARGEESDTARSVRGSSGAKPRGGGAAVEAPRRWQPTPAYTRAAPERRATWTTLDREEPRHSGAPTSLAANAVLAVALLFALASSIISLSAVY